MTQRGRSAVTLAQLLESGLLQAGQELRLRGTGGIGAVITQTGGVEYAGREYQSPSSAAKAARAGTSTNGWLAWQVEVDGRWLTLGDIRQRWLTRGER
jgi:hypothetical protein